jgi:DNA-binding LytR/AlgR family response regulator
VRCIAIDDEKFVLDLLVDNIQKIPYLKLVRAFKNPIEASEFLQSEKIDLIFLDIQMPMLNGSEFLKILNHPPMVILVTAYQQYALEGYDLNVIDYLLKPVSFERFLKACNKAHELYILRQNDVVEKEPVDYIFVNVEYAQVKVVVSQVTFIEALKDYVKIYTVSSSRPVMTKMSMKAIEEKLPANQFVRIHKSFIVAIDKITSVKREFVCIGEKEIRIGDSFKDNISKIVKP